MTVEDVRLGSLSQGLGNAEDECSWVQHFSTWTRSGPLPTPCGAPAPYVAVSNVNGREFPVCMEHAPLARMSPWLARISSR